MDNFKIGNLYSFTTYAPAVLGQTHRQMRLMAIGDYRLGSMFENVDIRRSSILSYLGTNATEDASTDTYLVFRTETGSNVVFGMSWINLNTLETTSTLMITVTIEGVSNDDAARVREVLAFAGYNKVTTSVTDVTQA